ncbi:MAG: arginine--tRNA ligase [Chitinophagaceae bacterium]|nr:arginine--tRNA ligase [Chitinophagaceae bacterium]
MKTQTVEILKSAFKKVLNELDCPIEDKTYGVKKTELGHGDYASRIALSLTKMYKTHPHTIATNIAERLKSNLDPSIYAIEVAIPGYINIRLSDQALLENLTQILNEKQKYCSEFIDDPRVHVVEYSSPNIAKPFTIGHLRSTIIGDSIARILIHCGYRVVRDNHLGDWGTQFGKMMVALKKWGNLEKIKNSVNPVKDLVDLYQRFHKESKEEEKNGNNFLITQAREWFVSLENGDTEARSLWKFCVDLSMMEFNKIYQRLGINFDTYLGESFFEDKMHLIFTDMREKGIGQESEGALVIFFPEDILPPLLVRKNDGSTLYATRDLATDLYRIKRYGGDVVIINEVGKEQTQYFQQIYTAEQMLGYFEKDQRIHIKHGLYRFPEGKMSTREGNVIWLEEVLDEAVEKALSLCNNDRTSAEIIAMGAIKFNDLVRDPENDISFSWEKILNMKGDSGPYIQYTAVRIASLIQKAFKEDMRVPVTVSFLTVRDNDRKVLRILEGFFESLENARKNYSTGPIATYLIKLCREYNKYYTTVNIINDRNVTGLTISMAVREIIELGLNLLGIKIPEKM